jgi:hypothetical protein
MGIYYYCRTSVLTGLGWANARASAPPAGGRPSVSLGRLSQSIAGPDCGLLRRLLASQWPFVADIDLEWGVAWPMGGGVATARQLRPLWSAVVRSARGSGGCRPARGRLLWR